jgi:hypothetical protein
MGYLDLVIGQGDQQFPRRVGEPGQAIRQLAPQVDLDLVDQLPQDVRHQRPLAVGQRRFAGKEQVANDPRDGRTAGRRLVARKIEQLLEVRIVGFVCPGGHGRSLPRMDAPLRAAVGQHD